MVFRQQLQRNFEPHAVEHYYLWRTVLPVWKLLVSAKTFKPYLAFYFPRTADILNV